MKLTLNPAPWIFLILGLFGSSSFALELEYLNQVVLPHKMKFQKSKIGGLSGLFYETSTGKLFAVCDDRGLVNEPRLYEFKIQVSLKDFKVEPEKVIFLTVNESELSHKTTASSSKLFSRILDLESISMAPWGDFLLTNEGDMSRKPRVNPQFLSANTSGTLMREFEVPKDYLPEPSGMQKKGVQNNLAFEGISMSPDGKEWLLAMEAPLVQDAKGFVRFLQYDMPEAWVLKPGKEYKYPMPEGKFDPQSVIEFQKGVSELQFINDHELLVMERLLEITKKGLKLQIQIFQTDLKAVGSDGLLTKKMLLDLETLEPKIGKVGNFEGMAWGPLLSDGRQSLILVSDDNFMRDQRTQFLLFAVKTGKK